MLNPNQKNEKLGPKTINLMTLKNLGLNIPRFISIDSDLVMQIFEIDELLDSVIEDIKTNFPCKQYAIRSSALIEDTSSGSMAGQFKTELGVKPDEVKDAIKSVLNHAHIVLNGNMGKFSIIVQDFVEPDYAGVIFTRNPSGSRELVFEYTEGRGENLVSGKIIPNRVSLYWNNYSKKRKPDFLTELIKQAKLIEEYYGFPQDIEWCIKQNIVYFLQTRPITTISDVDYKKIKFLDEYTTKYNNSNFFLEKTEISEVCPRPVPFMDSLLNRIYRNGGPVHNIYKQHRIQYNFTDFLELAGNELFVDRNKEIKSILPAYKLNKNKPCIGSLNISLLYRTFANILNLQRINSDSNIFKLLFDELSIRLNKFYPKNQSLENSLKNFHTDYEVIFHINLISEKALSQLKTILRKEPEKLLEALEAGIETKSENNTIEFDSSKFIGNSLDIKDTSSFFKMVSTNRESDWFESLPTWRKRLLEKPIQTAQNFMYLREIGRWLTVKNISNIRFVLQQKAKDLGFNEHELMYFHTIEEIIDNKINETVCKTRERNYNKFNTIQLPDIISNYLETGKNDNSPKGVSLGSGEGLLLKLEDFESNPSKGNIILFCQNLTPDLTKYFGRIVGIVSEKGSLLSHLAIIARERKVPIVTNVKFNSIKNLIGEIVTIDGKKGIVQISSRLKNQIA